MKHLSAFLTLLALLLATRASAQIDTTGGRYYKPLFANVTVTQNVVFGSAVTLQGATQTLRMDIYQPTGDTNPQRPVLIFAHEGAFVTGSKSDQPMTEICTRFARLGYVTASIDYRLISPLQLLTPADTITLGREAIVATQDMRAAVRFFRQDAATARQYRVHSGYIFAGGSSAGAFVALQTAYLDKDSEVPAYYNISQLGGLEGNSGNPGYVSAVRGCINLCGALGRREWLEAGSVPLVSLHGTADATVPYGVGTPGLGLPPQRLYGSGAIKPRADAVGVSNTLKPFKGAGHVPYNGTSATGVAYMDTTFRVLRDFLRPILREPGTVTARRAPVSLSLMQVYPVPATEAVRLVAAAGMVFRPQPLELLDATGRVVRRFRWEQPEQVVSRGALRAGLYLLRGETGVEQRIVFE
ncbi:alpha/beta hydrolase [Hymenobacter persicinus]|uniref:Alpha/beta hydrolase n=1 Tax=Hymenobacter persicinus TaxID=2025506 RepID=A0A4Q5LCC1_9BACT|nr:alpha/beta hydrolase [Hymenobacter persicinus]RYU78854.1 alpha/beta hydrolase [Hymenobacter persicinus]